MKGLYIVNYFSIHVSLLYADIVSRGTWSLLEKLKDPDLKGLASRLPATILHSRADSTVKKWAYKLDNSAKPHQFVLYLQHVNETSKSKAGVEEATNAMSWVHSCARLPSISANPFVKATTDELQQSLAKPTVKKRASYCGDVRGYGH